MIYFVDTHMVVALIDMRDQYHRTVTSFLSTFRSKMITTNWVMNETLNALADSACRRQALAFFDRFQSDSKSELIPYDRDLEQRGLSLYRNRPDKNWSLTDCISFTVMAERQLTDALTADHHSRQAGFNPIFAPSSP